MKKFALSLLLLGASSLPLFAAPHQQAGAGCTSPNGSLFNLEPRTSAVVQVARSVAFLYGGADQGNDLVVATASDARGLITNPNATLASEDAFYVQRSTSDCAPDFEGGEPGINTVIDSFGSIGTGPPTVVANATRKVFFIADLMSGGSTLDNGVGIIRTTAAGLKSTTDCPNGTEGPTGNCWPIGNVVNVTNLNSFLFHPHIAVDDRTTGTGAGDVYTVVTQNNSENANPHISLTACTDGLNCGNSVSISGSDADADFAWVQVRSDGGITISYANQTGGPGEQIKFVSCTPNGAPNTPTCSAPGLVTTERNLATSVNGTLVGDVNMAGVLYPKHVNRLEADGKTVTTFLVYDRCEVVPLKGSDAVCPKNDVVITNSNDGGSTWSPIAKVSGSVGQQFFGTIANDESTETVNIAYYSTENDPFQQQAQVFLAQVLPGTTTIGGIHQLTTAFADVQATPPLSFQLQPVAFGDRIGVATAGTGTAGQSHVYVTYTWNSVPGLYNGVSSPDVNNHLALFQY